MSASQALGTSQTAMNKTTASCVKLSEAYISLIKHGCMTNTLIMCTVKLRRNGIPRQDVMKILLHQQGM